MQSDPPSRWRRAKRGALAATALLLVLTSAFCANGLSSGWERPEFALSESPPCPLPGRRIRVLAYNLQKAGLVATQAPPSVAEVRARLDGIAALIREQDPDLVFLSEVVAECTFCPVDQVSYLAEATGMHARAFGEQFNFGLPVLRIRGGNAVLSRLPLRPLRNQQLCGGASFLWPANNRRALWCEVEVCGSWLRVASIHTDSASAMNNARQVGELLAELGGRPGILAGDFNATPDSESLRRLRASGRFVGAAAREPTFPAPEPVRRIDYVLAPAGWRVLREEMIPSTLSDHCPVVTDFEVPL